jgi:hypothetical protein
MSKKNDTPEPSKYIYPDGSVLIVDYVDDDFLSDRWSKSGGYAKRSLKKDEVVGDYDYRKKYNVYLHRLIVERMIGRPLVKGEVVDHINVNPLDNRRCNLRITTDKGNLRNRSRVLREGEQLKGVWLNKTTGRYKATITLHGKQYHLGYFATELQAHEAYCVAAAKMHGEKARFR